MNTLKYLLWSFVLIFSSLKTNFAYVKLFNTEDVLDTQSYDCIYYTNVTAGNDETIPYCIRTNESILLNRLFLTNSCQHSGKTWSFRSLKEMNVSQDEVLKWNSSIEMADRYAAYLTMGHKQLADYKICNCSPNTFGKFCEYEFMTMSTFDDTIQYQFDLKSKYRNGSQLWGNITCYTTLTNCYFGLRCLTWQNICDGKQQCMDGIDEDYCEELEFNECEENEYRCEDGSCIPEEYWLDGQYDCSDMSDEQGIIYFDLNNIFCPLTSSQFNCDETKTHYEYFACGDGQFVKDSLPLDNCYNYRGNMFFCEFTRYSSIDHPLWTLDNGHCVEKVRLENNLTDIDDSKKCIFYLKCQLTHNRGVGCDDMIGRFRSLCKNKMILYPPGPIWIPYAQMIYELSYVEPREPPDYVLLNGSIKCIGYQAHFGPLKVPFRTMMFSYRYTFDTFACDHSSINKTLGTQFDKNCWNATKQSYRCPKNPRCISKHRLQDANLDCQTGEDERERQCHTKNKHRFNCSGLLVSVPLCLSVSKVGDSTVQCTSSNDEYIIQLKWILKDRKCKISDSIECNIIRAYMHSPSVPLPVENDKVFVFRQYCDTVWDLPRGFDESLCNNWKCPKDEYQCMSGHCIPINYMFDDDYFRDWNCPDASDNIGLFRISQLSEHNTRLITDFKLESIKAGFYQPSDIFPVPVFATLCNYTKEYGCILANVNDPLNFTVNRPCINLTEIGDGTIDCYGGLDERNLLTCGNNVFEQRGFDFHCDDQECIPYHLQCEKRCSNDADSLLCDQLQTIWSQSCRYPPRESLCNFIHLLECDLFRSATYYCDSARSYYQPTHAPHRVKVWSRRDKWIYLREYPMSIDMVGYNSVQPLQHEKTNVYSHVSRKQENDGEEGWICGRGVAIKTDTNNTIQCFCPPSLYGEYCQYFSDRITIITSLHNILPELLEQQFNTIKMLVVLSSNDDMIDHHVFHLPFVLFKQLNKKFRFNLIHQRPKVALNSYTVRFEAYHLIIDSSIKLLGVWEYPIRFPFLPSYRLVQVLRFENEAISTATTHICKIANPCLHNSTCHSIMNQINNTSIYYCHCKSHSFGKHCQHLVQPMSSYTCSKHALQRSLSSSKSICLCPIHSYGPTCHLNHTCTSKNPCGIDRGKCYINPDNITRDYICICDKKFFGDNCELNSAKVTINFTDLSFVRNPSNFILSSIIQLCDLQNETLDLLIRRKRVYQGLPPSIIEIYHNNYYLPMLGVMKLYHKNDLSNDYIANLKQQDYFIVYIIPSNVSRMTLTSTMNMTNYCPYTPVIFQKNISDTSYLSQLFISNKADLRNDFNVSVMVFKYHLLCNALYSLMCFHDDNYFCVCDIYGHAECSRYNLSLDKCSERCRAGGQCIHGDSDDRKDFVCLCPRCYYGSICQRNTELFSFTLETLLTDDLYSPSVVFQRLFSSLLIIIPVILLLVGTVNNICCFVTFNRKKPLLVGIGHYLRTTSIINQLTLFILLLKLIHLVLTIKGHITHKMVNTILCKVLSYFLPCTSRISYWLMGMVAIERVYVTQYLHGTWLKSPRIAKRIIAIIIVGIAVFDVHEVIYYQSIEDPKFSDINNSTWCVTSYPSIIGTYNKVNIILNYTMPLLINLLSTIILIVLITRKRAVVTTKKVDYLNSEANRRFTFRSYTNLLIEHKELILAPLVTLLPQLFSLPQFILSVSFACQEFKVSWQRYLLIISYFITYLPQVLSYILYVSPSVFYKNEFYATKLSHKIGQWRQFVVTRMRK